MVVIETLLTNLPYAGIAAVSAGVLRSAAGWVENVLKDGKIDSYEWKQLGGTIVKYFGGISLLMFGLPLDASVAAMFALDVGTSAVKSAVAPPAAPA